jgi:hypothetical protein
MKNEKSFQNNQIYWRQSKKGWSIIVMPESIRIDNNHGYCHIHIEYKKNYQTINDNSFNDIYQLIIGHIEKNNGINMDDLKKELL